MSGWTGRNLCVVMALALGLHTARSTLGGVRETVTLSNVDSIGALGLAGNDVRTITLAGGYTAGTVHIIGAWANPGGVGATRPSHSFVEMRQAGGVTRQVALTNVIPQVPDGTVLTSATLALDGLDPAGQWTLEFYEQVDDAPGAVDSRWTTLTFEFEDQAVVPDGADVTLCELFDLQQVARIGNEVALTCATTSWNIGTRNLIWLIQPDERHPYIGINVYRLANDRFEQIGVSWAKHGFNALSLSQCGGFCNPTPGDSLGVGCTDTYQASTNALQGGLGPRHEIDPWSGAFTYAGSTLQTGIPGGDTPITRRVRVQDADLDPAANVGAAYFFETFYVARDDVDAMNNAAWKPFAVTVQDQFAQWQFAQTSATTPPNPGFALNAWSGAQQTILAQQVPVNEFSSPDGRCLLAAKAIDQGNGTWRYEYALMNIDMDRQVGRFEVDVPFGVQVSAVGFHAPKHFESLNAPVAEGGVAIDNQSWVGVRSDTTVRWTTQTNPLRWGTVHNYWFVADRGPADGGVVLGLFRAGVVSQIGGVSDAPDAPPACVGDASGDRFVNFSDVISVLAQWGGAGPAGDADGNGLVEFTDVLVVLGNWQSPCP